MGLGFFLSSTLMLGVREFCESLCFKKCCKVHVQFVYMVAVI